MVQKFALVTGAHGFIGSHMVDYLLSQGYKVRATDLSYAPRTYLNPEAEFRPCDLTEKDRVSDLLQDIDIVFHFAAIFNFSAPLDIISKVNVGGTKNLLEACRDFPDIQRIVIAGTGAFYDAKRHKPPEIGFDEEGSVKPRNNYCITKLAQEKLSLSYARDYGLPVVVARLAGTYGERSLYGVGQVILFLAKGQLPFIPGKGDKPVALVHVEDAVRAAEFLSRASEKTIGQIYNVADDTIDPVADLLRLAAKQIPDVKLYGHAPAFVIRLLVKYCEWQGRRTGKTPKIEGGTVDYILHPFRMDSRKLKALGFVFKHPQMKNELKKVIDWYGPFFREGKKETLRVLELTEESRENVYRAQQINYRLENLLQGRKK